jgi:DNA-binding transcriptional regulator PaaX
VTDTHNYDADGPRRKPSGKLFPKTVGKLLPPTASRGQQPFVVYTTKGCIAFAPSFGQTRRMQPKTEEFLHLLLWSTDMLMRPTFRNLTDSYESWAYRNDLLRQVSKLTRRKLLERDSRSLDDRLYRLTEQGRLHALGGRDPEEYWARPWDGQWRLVLFDVPTEQNIRRDRLRRYLRGKGFGYLQNSVWISPDPLTQEGEILGTGKINVESLILLEARPCAGESDTEIVAGAWDFGVINRRYTRHLKVLGERPPSALKNETESEALLRWAAAEREAWLEAVTNDPLLPGRILPSDYLGQRAWRRRVEVLRAAGQQLRTFRRP